MPTRISQSTSFPLCLRALESLCYAFSLLLFPPRIRTLFAIPSRVYHHSHPLPVAVNRSRLSAAHGSSTRTSRHPRGSNRRLIPAFLTPRSANQFLSVFGEGFLENGINLRIENKTFSYFSHQIDHLEPLLGIHFGLTKNQ
jgi:hypothetical protein